MRATGTIAKVIKHGHERWRYSWYDLYLCRHSRLFHTRAEALEAQRREIGAGTFDDRRTPRAGISARMSLAEYVECWNRQYPVARRLKRRTQESYANTLRLHVVSARAGTRMLGELPIRDALAFDRLRSLLVAKREAGLGDNSLRIIIATLRVLCGSARRDGLLWYDPTDGLRKEIRLTLPTGRRRAEHIRAFTQPQLECLLSVARKESELWDAYTVLANGGMRIGEALALQLDDILVDVGPSALHTLRIARELDNRGRLDTPKSGSGRTIGLAPAALAALRARLKLRAEWKLCYGWPEMPPWIFTTRSGLPYSQRNVHRDLVRILRRAGLPADHSPHDFRHTFASLHLTAGKPVKWVQEQLGHATAALTTDLYGKWIPTELPATDLATGHSV
jgi:integrase